MCLIDSSSNGKNIIYVYPHLYQFSLEYQDATKNYRSNVPLLTKIKKVFLLINAAATLVAFAFEYKVRTPHNYSKVIEKDNRHGMSSASFFFYSTTSKNREKKRKKGSTRNNSNHK